MRQASRICLSRSHPGLQTSSRTLVFNAHSKPQVPTCLRPAPRAPSRLPPPTGDTRDHSHEWGAGETIPGPLHPENFTASPCLSFFRESPESEIRVGRMALVQAMHGRGLQLPAQQWGRPAHGIHQHCPLQRPCMLTSCRQLHGQGQANVF